MESPLPLPAQAFKQNAFEMFMVKHGKRIGAGVMLGANIALIAHPLWGPLLGQESANFSWLRNVGAAGGMSLFHLGHLLEDTLHMPQMAKYAYACGVVGSSFHVVSFAQEDMAVSAVTWGVFGAYALKGTGILNPVIDSFKNKPTIADEFKQNKKDMLIADPQTGTGSLRFTLAAMQLCEQVAKGGNLAWFALACMAGAAIYTANGVAKFLRKKKENAALNNTA